MKEEKNKTQKGTVDNELMPIKFEKPAENPKLRYLTDDEIIQGFRYLIHKDDKK